MNHIRFMKEVLVLSGYSIRREVLQMASLSSLNRIYFENHPGPH